MTDTQQHEPTAAKRVMGVELVFNGKNWSDKFVCPTCGAHRRANLSFLGGRKIVCTGTKLSMGGR